MQPRSRRPKIGLALGSGGARGLAHIGVIQALLVHHIPIDYIAGTSAGALIGGMFAAIGDIYAVREIWERFSYKNFLSLVTDIGVSKGILKGDKAEVFLNTLLGGPQRIERLPIPFQAVATDMYSGEIIRYAKGDLVKAIRASGSLPFVFQPCYYKNRVLIDGGVSEPVPVSTVKMMGADIVIAVNLDYTFFSSLKKQKKHSNPSMVDIVRSTINLLRYHLAEHAVTHADIVIQPNLVDAHLLKFVHGQSIIDEGKRATMQHLKKIKQHLQVRGLPCSK